MASRVSIEWSTVRFNQFITQFVKATELDTAIVLKKFMFDLMTRVIMRTPVDTGRARAGWGAAGAALDIDVGAPNVTDGKPIDSGQYEEQLSGDKQFIRATNNVDYILPLEFGHSRQSPFGMVRISMNELRSGQDLSGELMAWYADRWSAMGGQQRYRSQKNVLGDVFNQAKNQPMPKRMPKADMPARSR